MAHRLKMVTNLSMEMSLGASYIFGIDRYKTKDPMIFLILHLFFIDSQSLQSSLLIFYHLLDFLFDLLIFS